MAVSMLSVANFCIAEESRAQKSAGRLQLQSAIETFVLRGLAKATTLGGDRREYYFELGYWGNNIWQSDQQ